MSDVEKPGRIEDFLSKRGLDLAIKAGSGVALAAAVTIGLPAIIGAGVLTAAAMTAKMHFSRKSHQRWLLNLYQEEIAHSVKKHPSSINFDDLHQAAGRIPALEQELDTTKTRSRFFLAAGLLTTALLTTAIALAAPLLPAALMTSITGGAGMALIGTLIGLSMESALEKVVTVPPAYTLNRTIGSLTEQLKSRPVSAEQVMDVFVQADPRLQRNVNQKFGRNYADLPLPHKQHITKTYGEALHVPQFTDMLNQAKIYPAALGTLAYAPANIEPAPANAPQPHSSPENVSTAHQDRLRIERETTPDIAPTFH